MAQEPLDFFASDTFQSYTTSFPFRTRRKSSVVPGATRHSAIYSTSTTVLHDTLISFLSYIKTNDIPILPVTKPDIRTVLGEGASFLVNSAEVPRDYVDPSTGRLFPKGTIVALKRAKLINDMEDLTADRIRVIFNELLTMNHPPLAAHPNIVNLLGVGFETEGPSDTQNAMPVLIPEAAELGNLAECLETARKEDRPLAFHEKMSLCLDVLHGMEILHACDIVHGDVKAENILVFEKDDSKGLSDEEFRLHCKLTDFGVSRLPSGELVLGGSRPWQAPECHRGAYLRIEDAKRTDIYSFGMLLWRVCLDGDPFKSLGEFQGETAAERRKQRNESITRKKDSDSLVQHVCNSLALSDQFSRAQLDMLCEVISITLLKDPSRRELDVRRIIRLLTPDNWFQPRHVLPPARLPIDVHTNLLDLEKWHSEFEGISPVVQSFIVQGYRDYALSPQHELQSDHEEKRSAAAYQLAVCCANGFGGKFHPSECIKWLTFAAERGSQHAQDSLPKFLEAFPQASTPFRSPWAAANDDNNSTLSSSWGSDFISSGLKPMNKESQSSSTPSTMTFLSAAENCNYSMMEKMLDEGVKPTISGDGVSPLHFLSSWDLTKAEKIGQRLIKVGADVNAIAERGSTVGGTPLMWSVYGNHVDHSLTLLKLGANSMVAANNGEDSLAFAAKLHLADHLRLLLENTRPAHVRGHLHRLIEAAAGGESCFTRINRHGKNWQSAAADALELLQGWNVLFTDAANFKDLVIPAVYRGLLSPYGRMNTDVQMDFLDYAKVGPSGLNELLRESILSYNEGLLVALLDRGAPVSSKWGGKTLLHLCAKIPDHSLAATAFAPRLLTQGSILDSPDDNGITPWMDAVLERKWDLADLLMREGADARATNNEGTNIMGLCISAINLGAIKFLLKYTANKELFRDGSFMVNQKKQISALQLASSLSLPRSHGMKTEVMGTFLTILDKFASGPSQLDFRSDGLLPDASAIDIAAAKGNVYAVKALVKRGAQLPDAKRISGWAQAKLSTTDDFMQKKNMERCIYIIRNWEKDPKTTLKMADDWTNLRTIDESKIESSWENLVWVYKDRKGLRKEESSISRP